MIARIVLVISLVLLVAAPARGAGAAGSGAGLGVESALVEEPVSFADDEPMASSELAAAGTGAGRVRRARSEEVVRSEPGLARIFRPPRPMIA